MCKLCVWKIPKSFTSCFLGFLEGKVVTSLGMVFISAGPDVFSRLNAPNEFITGINCIRAEFSSFINTSVKTQHPFLTVSGKWIRFNIYFLSTLCFKSVFLYSVYKSINVSQPLLLLKSEGKLPRDRKSVV